MGVVEMPAVRSRNDISTLGQKNSAIRCDGLIFALTTDCTVATIMTVGFLFKNPYEYFCLSTIVLVDLVQATRDQWVLLGQPQSTLHLVSVCC